MAKQKEKVWVSRTTLATLLGEVLAARQLYDALDRFMGQPVRPIDLADAEDVPACLDWEGIDRNNAIKEAKHVLGITDEK